MNRTFGQVVDLSIDRGKSVYRHPSDVSIKYTYPKDTYSEKPRGNNGDNKLSKESTVIPLSFQV